MKKKYIIVFAVQTFLVAILLIYAFVQKAIADENLSMANFARMEAEKMKKIADNLAIQLVECKNSK